MRETQKYRLRFRIGYGGDSPVQLPLQDRHARNPSPKQPCAKPEWQAKGQHTAPQNRTKQRRPQRSCSQGSNGIDQPSTEVEISYLLPSRQRKCPIRSQRVRKPHSARIHAQGQHEEPRGRRYTQPDYPQRIRNQ